MDNFFINKIVNSGLYQQLFNNRSLISSNNYTTNSIDSYLTNLRNSNIKGFLSEDVTPDASYSYANTNKVDNLFNTPGDGFYIYREKVYDEFVKKYPNFSQARRDKFIENEWNSLSNEEKEVYNNRATGSSSSSYNPNNITSYRSPLISEDYNRNRGSTLSLSSECPPGETKVGDDCISHSLYNDGLTEYS